ncbi:MAG: sialidase family protein [Xanthomonadaceae bacterium]|nr:sialidase family protein [Xanthomonadaceae bacterium]
MSMHWIQATLVALLLSAAVPAHAQHGGQAGRPSLGASAVFDGDGVLWAVDAADDRVRVRRSEDQGRTWSAPVPVNAAAEPIAADGDSRPKIAVGTQGELYLTWTKPLARPYTGEIRFSRSLDAGQSWSAPITVHADRQEITHRFDALTVTDDGTLFIAWIDKRDQERAKAAGQPYRGAAVYFAVSDDRGASFRGDYRMAEHSCECCRIATQADGDGVIALWRHVFEPNIRDHAIARMNPDGSVSPIRRATFDQWAIDACPHHGPSLVKDAGGRLHAVWFALGPENAGVFYGRLEDGRVDGQRQVGGDRAEHADLAVLGESVVVVWREFDGRSMHLKAMRSDDGGESWRQHALAATEDISDHPKALVHDGRFLAYWNTREVPHRVVPLP